LLELCNLKIKDIIYLPLSNAFFITIETKSISCCFQSNKHLAKGLPNVSYIF